MEIHLAGFNFVRSYQFYPGIINQQVRKENETPERKFIHPSDVEAVRNPGLLVNLGYYMQREINH